MYQRLPTTGNCRSWHVGSDLRICTNPINKIKVSSVLYTIPFKSAFRYCGGSAFILWNFLDLYPSHLIRLLFEEVSRKGHAYLTLKRVMNLIRWKVSLSGSRYTDRNAFGIIYDWRNRMFTSFMWISRKKSGQEFV